MGGAQGLEEDEAQIGNKTLARFKLGRTPDQKKKKIGQNGMFSASNKNKYLLN